MAGLGASRAAGGLADAGIFGPRARGQYAALAAMRTRLFVNGFRTLSGAFELGARTVSFFIYCLMGLSLGVGAAVASYALVSHHHWQSMALEFWLLSVVWLAIAIALASFQEQYDLSGLLHFPVRFWSFFLLHLIFGLVDVSTIVGGMCLAGIVMATTIARPALFGPILVAAAGLAAFNILMVRAVLSWIDRWLAKRRSREILSAFFLLSLVGLQLFNPLVRNKMGQESGDDQDVPADSITGTVPQWVAGVRLVQRWLPPGLTASVPAAADEHRPLAAAESLGGLSLFVLAAGGLLAVRLRAEYRGESLGEAPARSARQEAEESWRIAGSGPLSAQMEKEVRTMLRSMTQIYSVAVPMLMVFVIASLFRNGAPMVHQRVHLALPISVAYGLLGFTQLMYNNLGAEGKGIQMLFLFPVRMRTVLLAKNLFHGMLYLAVACGSALLASIRMGRPEPVLVVITLGWLAFALPANLAAGNLLSLTMAYRVNLSRIGRQSGSQANALVSMVIQAVILGVGALVISLSNLFGQGWIAAPVFVVLAAGASTAWVLVLNNADRIANTHRDALITRLARID